MGSKSVMVYECEDYGLRLEYNKDFVIFHLPYVNKFNKGVLLDIKTKLENWLDFFKDLGYNALWAAIEPENTKMVKLMPLLGFSYAGSEDSLYVYSLEELV